MELDRATRSGLREYLTVIARLSRRSPFLPTLLVAVGLAVGLGCWVAERDGDLRYDDAVYLERGAFHARQVAARPTWQWPFRLAYSLRFEHPKPPLFHGWVASTALLTGTRPPGRWIAVSALAPFAVLAGLVAWGGSRQGRLAGWLALAALFSIPSQVSLGTSVMVETLLAAIVTACALLAEPEFEKPSSKGALALGIGCGLAALTKATAPTFLALLVLALIVAAARRSGIRTAVRQALLVSAAALVVAVPWYGPWLREALDHARLAVEFPAWADAGSTWTRPLRLLGDGLGVPLTVACGLIFAWPAAVGPGQEAAATRRRRWAWTCALVAVPPAVATVWSPNFDPRFWVPCLGPLAIAVGRRASEVCGESRRARFGVAVLCLVLPGLSLLGLLRRPHVPTPWAVGEWLAARAPAAGSVLKVCTLGSAPDWNVYKIRLVSALERGGRQREIHELPAWRGSAPASPAACDVVFALDPGSIPRDPVHEFSNFELRSRQQDLEAAGLSSCGSCGRELGDAFRGTVWLRREAGRLAAAEDGGSGRRREGGAIESVAVRGPAGPGGSDRESSGFLGENQEMPPTRRTPIQVVGRDSSPAGVTTARARSR